MNDTFTFVSRKFSKNSANRLIRHARDVWGDFIEIGAITSQRGYRICVISDKPEVLVYIKDMIDSTGLV